MMNTTGAFQTEAMFMASWNVPMFVAPSPKKVRRGVRTSQSRRTRRADSDRSPAPTMAYAPSSPLAHIDEVHRPPDAAAKIRSAAHHLREAFSAHAARQYLERDRGRYR